jgi:hypothetical protein
LQPGESATEWRHSRHCSAIRQASFPTGE